MKKVIFLQHGDVDKPGLLAETLAACGVDLEVLPVYQNQGLDLGAYDGLALGGGGQSAYELEKFPYLAAECEWIRQAVDFGKPVIGLCLGAQLIAQALGASVKKAPQKEIGFFTVHLHGAASVDPLLGALPKSFPATHWHGDVFEIPANAVCLGSSALTPHQILRYGRSCYGFQFHLEMTAPLFQELVEDAGGYFLEQGIDPDALIQESKEVLPSLEPYARDVFRRWAALL